MQMVTVLLLPRIGPKLYIRGGKFFCHYVAKITFYFFQIVQGSGFLGYILEMCVECVTCENMAELTNTLS